MTSRNRVKRRPRWLILCVFLFPLLSAFCSSATTLDDLKKLEIICFVPSHLPKGFRLKNVEITYDKLQDYEDKNHPLPLYSVEYGNDRKAAQTRPPRDRCVNGNDGTPNA